MRVRNASGARYGSKTFDVSKVVLKSPNTSWEHDYGEITAGQVTDYVNRWPIYPWPKFDLYFEYDGEITEFTYTPDITPWEVLESGSYTYEIRGFRETRSGDSFVWDIHVVLVEDESSN